MDFHQLIQTAHGQISLQPISLENNHPIESIQMLDLSQSLKSTILYFADDTIDYKYQKPDRSIQLIAVKKPPEGWLDEHSNLALLTQKDFIPTFNWIHQQIYQSIQMSNHFARLIGMSLRGDSKQDIINTAAQFLQAPLIVIDSGFQILTASNNLPILDTLWA